jgi:hypothetical protein
MLDCSERLGFPDRTVMRPSDCEALLLFYTVPPGSIRDVRLPVRIGMASEPGV